MFVALEGFMILLLLVGVLDYKQEYFYFDLTRTIVLFFLSLSYDISANLIMFRKYFYPDSGCPKIQQNLKSHAPQA